MITFLVVVGAAAALSLIIGIAVGNSMATERNLDRSRRQARRQQEINEDATRLDNQAAELEQLIQKARRVLYNRKPQDH